MDPYPQSQLMTSRGFTYNYIHIPASSPDSQTILFLHGFPSSVFHWRHQIKYFSQKGYGIIAPELLGYGKSSKPLDEQAYTGKGMSDDVKEILDHEKLGKVVGVAHDWGSFLLSRMANFHPGLFSKYVFVDVGYSPLGQGLTRKNVEFINAMVQQHMGFSVFGYFLFFDEKDAAEIMDKNIDSVESLFHVEDDELKKKYMGAPGGTRTWFEAGMTAPKPAYLTAEDQADFRKEFAPSKGGFAPAINWYRAQLHDINAVDEKGLFPSCTNIMSQLLILEAEIPQENYKLQQPTLLLTGNNIITATADFPKQMKPNAPNLEVKNFDAGHWIQLEKPDETNETLGAFFEK
ncbi:Bifunctional epoxide hydrolase 2 [Lachnellula arida]|uniref:Bifunctional epoxide hydrolase 2 n=1 Tax=Lachnellula arida TaxID=1316785 RepID=A0A8T9B6T3_9HELO|nr:Bifunctional epoxide hydrolase 2 [Lachnellula arida]